LEDEDLFICWDYQGIFKNTAKRGFFEGIKMNMRVKIAIGWIVLLIISLFPVFLWFHFGSGAEEFTDFTSMSHGLGELFGLVGMTMFALTFMLSTRIGWIEDVFGGLDKVYITHAILGGTALIMILAHPIFLVLNFVPAQINLAAKYLLPSSYWSVNLGIIALLGMIALIFITLYTKIKYHRWKFTHEFLGLIFCLAVLHIFLVRNSISQDNIFDGYYIYATIVSLIGFFGFSYSLFIKNRLFKNAVYSVTSIRQKNEFFEIVISPEHKPVSYKAGQFVFLRFYNENVSKEAHPFSIASKTDNEQITIVAKKLGDYTSKLAYLKEGDKVSVEGPYGRFNYKRFPNSDQVWIAGGIGITPFIGMVQDFDQDSSFKGDITLFYSVKHHDDLIGDLIFKNVVQKRQKFRYVPWISKERGRLSAKSLDAEIGNLDSKEFFICGPTGFKEGIMRGLIKKGISKGKIHEEVFDFR
jgi:predicted ferric reductase